MQLIVSATRDRAVNAKFVELVVVREVGPGRPRKELCFENIKGDAELVIQIQSITNTDAFFYAVCDALATGLSVRMYVDDNGDAVETFGGIPMIEGHID